MKHDTQTTDRVSIDLAEKYRPVGLGAVRAAFSATPATAFNINQRS